MKVSEFVGLMEKFNNIVVRSKSGIDYVVNKDQQGFVDENNDLVYGYYLKPHIRSKSTYKWFKLKNMMLIRGE